MKPRPAACRSWCKWATAAWSKRGELAAHAQQIGADATSAVAPYYFKPNSIGVLVDCLAEIAGGAPKLPFYYYHIPELSGVHANMVELLQHAPARIPNFAGIKYTAPFVNEFQTLVVASAGRFDILFGRDEMLLSGLAGGATGAVGSTYNFAAPLYRRVMAAFERGDVEEAKRCQGQAVAMVNVLLSYRGHAGLKAAMGLRGLDCGPTRLPNRFLETRRGRKPSPRFGRRRVLSVDGGIVVRIRPHAERSANGVVTAVT